MDHKKQTLFIQGNEAIARAALVAGCNFFAGYPITPASEITEIMSRELPRHGGSFIQMEDEIASMGAITGASLAGAKSMTATSGPGFSLMQENIGFASVAEVPCVIVNVMRGGASTGLPTNPGQITLDGSKKRAEIEMNRLKGHLTVLLGSEPTNMVAALEQVSAMIQSDQAVV